MRWYLDTHKFMSEITRKALQIIVQHGVTSESEPEEIEEAEKDLARAGVYKDFDGAKGRIRRALFTYFKAYGCIDANERLTELGQLFVDNKITVRELCFHYILNYQFQDEDVTYYPVQFILSCFKKLEARGIEHLFISAYDFSKIVECNSVNDINEEFIDELISARQGAVPEVNERGIGFDVWSNILISAGLVRKTADKALIPDNYELYDWILSTYENDLTYVKGQILSGVFCFLPTPPIVQSNGAADDFSNEGRALKAFLFDSIDNRVIEKYIFTNLHTSLKDMLEYLGLTDITKGFYTNYAGLEHLIGYCLIGNENLQIRTIGSIIASVELTEAELTEITPQEVRINYDVFDRKDGGINTLLYGVPGSGKSWTIEHEYCYSPDERIEVSRLVFHPDYTNADFVGQILPTVDEDKQVTYEFTAGPFTTILRDAYEHPQIKYILVIEEINRGNAPAIFGEVFQLLDRLVEEKTIDGITYKIGTSEYGVTHKYMADFIYGDPKKKVRIPSNLSIIGTMNTSDQNVFTLDTAFQRRWNMRLIENNFDNVRSSLAEAQILDTNVNWKRFCEIINELVVGNRKKMASAEDKRLGVYFVHEKDLVFDDRAHPSEGFETLLSEYNSLLRAERLNNIDTDQKNRLKDIREALIHNRLFPEKVIKYLWDDAFKFNPEVLFDTNENKMDSLEKVIRTFIFSSGANRFDIFKDSVRQKLYQA